MASLCSQDFTFLKTQPEPGASSFCHSVCTPCSVTALSLFPVPQAYLGFLEIALARDGDKEIWSPRLVLGQA